MSRSLLLSLALVLSLLGVADSWYLYESAVTDTALTCDIGAGLDGCNVVAQSPYSQFLGIPLALYGVGFFGLLFAVAAAQFFVSSRRLTLLYLGLSAFGAAASLVFMYIQFFLIKALCIYCLLSAAITFALLGIAWRLRRPSKAPLLDS